MKTPLILHDGTRAQLDAFLASPAHGLLLAGSDGIGKTAIAEALLTELLQPRAELADHPYFMHLSPIGATISIESIRSLQKFLQLKTTGTAPLRRAVLLEHAHTLTTEAQNAFLKLLEEPPADTVVALTANSPRTLLPTILSRVQTITVHPPSENQLQPLLEGSAKDTVATQQAYFLSGGLPGLLTALLSSDEAHPLLESVATAKLLLQKSTVDRLSLVDSLSKQKDAARGVFEALSRIADSGLQTATARQDAARLAQWHHIRKIAFEAREQLEANANPKLVLTNSFLQL
ncbi:MAG TPA: AAA family ATPase [Candidatus Saccharimonadales bacterium]|nr:AAA family ATPase [Candidatus Saccharimonadales bacterium]